MIHKLSLKVLAGIDKLPSFYSYVKEHKNSPSKMNIVESVELSKGDWNEIKDDFKGVYNGIPHYIDLHESVLKMVPVKGSWLHNQDAFEDKTGGPPHVEGGGKFEDKKNASSKEPSFNNFEKMDATGKAAHKEACPATGAAKNGEKSKEQAQSEKEHSDPKSTTYDQASENNKDETPKEACPGSDAVKEAASYEEGNEVRIGGEKHPLKGKTGKICEVGNGYYKLDLGKEGQITVASNESAEEKAKSIIASVYNKSRKTVADAGNHNADAGKHEDELDSYKSDITKTVDQAEHKADKLTKETAEFNDSPDRNPKIPGEKFADKKNASTKKPSFDNFKKMGNKDAIHGNALEEALKFLENIHPDMVKAADGVAKSEAGKNPFGKEGKNRGFKPSELSGGKKKSKKSQ
jgi:hypothetical protein